MLSAPDVAASIPNSDGDPGMLQASGWIEQSGARRANTRSLHLHNQIREPGVHQRLHVVVQENQNLTACCLNPQIVHPGEMEWSGIGDTLAIVLRNDLFHGRTANAS